LLKNKIDYANVYCVTLIGGACAKHGKKIHTNVNKTAHGIPRRGWGIAWESFGSVVSSFEHSNEFLVSKKCGKFLDSLSDSSSLNRGYSQWTM
jgi:hypothetical protein